MFQFYLSSIKSPGRLPQEGVDDGFNSTLVQLKVYMETPMPSTIQSFNSTLVQLKGECL